MTSEQPLLKQIMLASSQLGARLFRNNVGLAWTGRTRKNDDGSITIFDPRPVRMGLTTGSGDLIGWSPDGRFMSVEVKAGRTATTDEQEMFAAIVTAAGGIGLIVRSVDEVIGALNVKN